MSYKILKKVFELYHVGYWRRDQLIRIIEMWQKDGASLK